jgi:hypothetical protein
MGSARAAIDFSAKKSAHAVEIITRPLNGSEAAQTVGQVVYHHLSGGIEGLVPPPVTIISLVNTAQLFQRPRQNHLSAMTFIGSS